MRSTFGGLEIAKRSLAAHQAALGVTSHNIANANAPGYTRQSAVLRATSPYTVPGTENVYGAGQVGTGVEVTMIRRMGDQFIQAEMTKEARNSGYWGSRQQILRQLEVALMEPSDTGVQAAFQKYWAALQEVHKSPESLAVRSVLVEEATVLAETLQYARSQMVPIQRELDQEMQRVAQRLNTLGDQIAALNKQIANAQVVGYEPNDLLDQRDLLVEEVSRLAGATVSQRNNGMIAVIVGGVSLVDGAFARSIMIEPDTSRPGLTNLRWSDLGTPAKFDGGQMQSNFEGRDQIIPEHLAALDRLASTLISEINAIHRQGIGLNGATGHDFFVGTDAKDIAVNPLLKGDLESIGAAASRDPGDGQVALQMSRLSQSPVMDGATFDNYFASIVSRLGVTSQKALAMVEHQADVENHLVSLRESVAGVNLDEEMSNMIMFQHAYAAAARVVNAMDEALDTLINRMGLVGR